jgi:predicted DNA-binding antitoxin AbrB/MazE fold protein
MSIKAKYADGVFKPLEKVKHAVPGEVYQIFSEGELRKLTEDLAWLRASEKSFEFWDNKEDAVYDKL